MKRLTKWRKGIVVYVGNFDVYGDGQLPAEVNQQGVRQLLLRLAAYEDTGLEPLKVNDMKAAHRNALSTSSELRKALVDKREELKTACDSISQLDGANSSLIAANEKLAADRKALINELCQYCGKYKQAHEGACDGCKWREM